MTRMIGEAQKRRPLRLVLLPVLAAAAVLLIVAGGASSANTHPAYSTFTTTSDVLGPNDVPGQKDLTQQGTNNSDEANGNLWVMWAWDDTSISGKNTLDACTLFDTNANGNANEALCLTLGKSGSSLAIQNTTLYSCGDGRPDRCSSTIASVALQGSFCEIELSQSAPTGFDSPDTQAYCDVKVTALGLSSTTNLLNTCSYPSQQPNSDPSDCVLVPGAVNSTTDTTPFSSSSWTVTLNDTAAVTNATGGTVTFKLFGPSDATCAGTPLWTATANVDNSGNASTFPTGGSQLAGSPSGANVVSTVGTYHWTADYSGQSGVNGSSKACGEAQTVSAPGVS